MSLKADVIHLAHTNPELRPHLLPLIRGAAWRSNINVALVKKDIDKFIRHQLAMLEGVGGGITFAARDAKGALNRLADLLDE